MEKEADLSQSVKGPKRAVIIGYTHLTASLGAIGNFKCKRWCNANTCMKLKKIQTIFITSDDQNTRSLYHILPPISHGLLEQFALEDTQSAQLSLESSGQSLYITQVPSLGLYEKNWQESASVQKSLHSLA